MLCSIDISDLDVNWIAVVCRRCWSLVTDRDVLSLFEMSWPSGWIDDPTLLFRLLRCVETGFGPALFFSRTSSQFHSVDGCEDTSVRFVLFDVGQIAGWCFVSPVVV